MSDQNIISLGFDPEKFDASKNHILEGLQQVKQIALELPAQFKATFDSIASQSGSTIKAGSTGGFTELKSKIGELQTTTEIYNKAVQVTTDRVAAMNGQSKEFSVVLLNEVKAVKEAAAAKLNDAKATTETTKAKILETKETERSAAAKVKEAQKTKELSEPYKQLALRFAAAANEAKNLAAQYGTTDKRAQDAAKAALALNNQLKTIDSSIGNHQREVGNYGKAVESAGEKLKHLGMEFLSLIGIFSVASFFKDSIDAFLELDKATRLLQNTLRNVGAPELFGRIEESTKKLTTQFKFLREEDIQTTFNKLIVYGKLTENQINDLLPVIINFATATGKDLPEATALIIKGLEGNGKALREFGINMKDAKSVTEGFSLVMDELKPRVDGVADAFGESAAGKIAASKEEFRKLKEEVGSGLIPVFITLLGWADKLLTGFGYLGKRLRELGEDILSFGKTASARELAKQLEIETKVAQKFVEEFDGKPIKEVSEAINELNLKLVERQRILTAAKANKSGIFTAQDVKDEELRIRIIRKELEGLYKVQDTNKNKILGPGDPDKSRDKKGPGHDAEADFFKNELEKRKFSFETQKKMLQDQIDNSILIIDDDKKTFTERLKAAQDFYDFSLILAQKQKDFELSNIDLQQAEDKRKAAKEITNREERNKVLKSIDEKANAEKLSTQASFNSAVNKLTNDDEKKRVDLFKKHDSEILAHDKSLHEQQIQSIQNSYDQQLVELEDHYAKQREKDKGNKTKLLKDEKEYNEKKLKIELERQVGILNAELKFAEAQLEIEKARVAAEPDGPKKTADLDAIAKAEGTLTALRIKLHSLYTQIQIKNNDDVKQSNADLFKKWISDLQNIASVVELTFKTIGGFIDANVTKEKNRLQSLTDANNKFSDEETQRIENSTLSEQDKAAKLIQLKASTDAKNRQFAHAQKEEDIKKAKFDKAAAIASIILNTAVAISKDLKATPVSLPQLIFDAATGAAELAIALRTPIPTYAGGTQDHPGGPARYGEAGPEAVVLPGGKTFIANKDTVSDLPAHAKVIPLSRDYVNEVMYSSMMRKTSERLAMAEVIEMRNESRALDTDRIVAAIEKSNKKVINRVSVTNDFGWIEYINKNIYGKG